MTQDKLIESYKLDLLRGIIKSRVKHFTGFSSVMGITIYSDTYKQIRRSVRWILTHRGVQYKVTDRELTRLLGDIGVRVIKEVR